MSFEKAYAYTKKFEGGYANNPKDRGGETFRGISRKNWPAWEGWPLIDRVKAQGKRSKAAINTAFAGDAAMEKMVAAFYRHNFWVPFNRLEAPWRVQAKLFDTAVNVGVGAAVKMLQRAVNRLHPISKLEVDGRIGPRTEAALGLALDPPTGETDFLNSFVREQEDHYRRILQRDPSQAEFGNGWMNRAAWLP